jgi:hypothetical protein
VFEESFTGVLRRARETSNEAIRSYRLHGDIARVLEEAGRPLCELLRLAAYLTGHLDGLGKTLDDLPEARDLLARSRYEPFVYGTWQALRELWSRRGAWSSPAEFEPLYEIGRELLADGGLILQRLPGRGLYVDIPFSSETMPE